MHTVITGPLFVNMIKEGMLNLQRHKAAVNALNVFPVPDGDTGTNMALTLSAAVEQLGDVDADKLSLAEAAKRAARSVLLGARGNSGVILSQFLRGFADGVADKQSVGPDELAYALECATSTAYRAVIKPVEGTMLTVGKGASRGARQAAGAGADLIGVLKAAVEGAEKALARTPDLLAVLKKAGVVDAGGQGLVYFLQGILAACEGRKTDLAHGLTTSEGLSGDISLHEETGDGAVAARAETLDTFHGDLSAEEIVYGYCTEFLIRGRNLQADVIQAALEPLGDSLLVVGDSDLLKVHVHTENPGRALEIGVQHGELLDISIDNMREQNRKVTGNEAGEKVVATVGAEVSEARGAMIDNGESQEPPFPKAAALWDEPVRVGVVAVVPGAGWKELMLSLGVDQVVQGGQTMNPSAAELLEAIEAVTAPAVIVLPNNSNVVFAARQAQQLSNRDVHVIETTAPPAGVAAMMAYNPHGEPADVSATMDAAARRVRTAEIAYAARDSEAWGDEIKAGDKLGIVDGEIKVVVDDAERAALQTLQQLITPEMSFVSIYYGQEADAAAAERLARTVREKWPHCEVELFDGGQPVYFYLLSVE